MSDRDEQVRIHVDPEPTAEELVAIVAVVGALPAQAPSDDMPASPTRGRDRWALAGRQESIRPAEWEPGERAPW